MHKKRTLCSAFGCFGSFIHKNLPKLAKTYRKGEVMKKLTFVLVIFALFFAEAVFAAKCEKNFKTWVAQKYSKKKKTQCFKKVLKSMSKLDKYKEIFNRDFEYPRVSCQIYFGIRSDALSFFQARFGECSLKLSSKVASNKNRKAKKRQFTSSKSKKVLTVQHYTRNVAGKRFVGCKVGTFPLGSSSGKINNTHWSHCVKTVMNDLAERCQQRYVEKFKDIPALKGKKILKQLKCKPAGPWYIQGTADCVGTGKCPSKYSITAANNLGLASRRAGRVYLLTVSKVARFAQEKGIIPPRILKQVYEGRHVKKGVREARFFMPRRGAFVFVGLDKLVAYILRQPPQKARTLIKQVKPHVPKEIKIQLANHDKRITANENDLKHFHQNFSTVNISAGFTNLVQLDATNTPANPDGSSSGGLRVPKETVYAELAVRLGLGFRLNPKGLLLLAGEIWFARVATQGNMVPGWVVEAGYEWELFKDGGKKWKGKHSYKNRGKVFYAWSLQLTGGYALMNRNGYHIPFFGAHAVMYNHGFYLRFGLRLGLGLHAPPDKREWLTTTYLGLSVQLGWRGQN